MDEYTNKDFEDTIAFSVSELGAMGPNDTGFFTKDGKGFRLDYKSDDTPWSKIREWFPPLKECYFNGPMKTDIASLFTVVIGVDENDKKTRVPHGWKHWYLDAGNHLVIKEPYYREVKSLIGAYENVDLAFSWEEFLAQTDFAERAETIQKDYWKQKAEDVKLAKKLDELRQNPEYIEKVKAASGDMEAMMAVLKEYSGIDMDWFQLKQFGFRQQGLVWGVDDKLIAQDRVTCDMAKKLDTHCNSEIGCISIPDDTIDESELPFH